MGTSDAAGVRTFPRRLSRMAILTFLSLALACLFPGHALAAEPVVAWRLTGANGAYDGSSKTELHFSMQQAGESGDLPDGWSAVARAYGATDRPGWYGASGSVVRACFDDDITGVASLAYWFDGFRRLERVDGLRHLDTSKVTSCVYTFIHCDSLRALDLAGLDLSKVENVDGMIAYCTSLREVDLSGLAASSLTNFSYFATGCTSLERALLPAMSRVTRFSSSFSGCTSLRKLDLSQCDLSHVHDAQNMLAGCSSLRRVVFPHEASQGASASVFQLPSYSAANYTGLWESLLDRGRGYAADTPVTGVTFVGPCVRQARGSAYAVLTEGDAAHLNGTLVFFRSDASYENGTQGTFADLEGHLHVGRVFAGFESASAFASGGAPWYGYREQIRALHFMSDQPIRPVGTSYWFQALTNLTEFCVPEEFDTGGVADMTGMFTGCSGLASLDITLFDTYNLTRAGFLFQSCSSLTSLDASGINMSRVGWAGAMFYYCTSLVRLDVSGWSTSMYDCALMFMGCSRLSRIDLSSWNAPNLRTVHAMFQNCSSLRSLDLSTIDLGAAGSMATMFNGCPQLSSVVLGPGFSFTGTGASSCVLPTPSSTSPYTGKWVRQGGDEAYTAQVLATAWDGATMSGTWVWERDTSTAYAVLTAGDDHLDDGTLIFFRSEESLANDFVGTCHDVRGNAYVGRVFAGVESGPSVPWASYKGDIRQVRVAEGQAVRPMGCRNWFSDCVNLAEADLSGLDTMGVHDLGRIFANCVNLLSVDLSGLYTADATTMDYMFASCESLRHVDASSFDTRNVTNMACMFNHCHGLESVNVSSFDTSQVTNMLGMFYMCEKLTTLDVSGFDTSKVEDLRSVFAYCRVLESLDVSGFSNSSATSLYFLFSGCAKLTYLDLSGFDTTAVTDMQHMIIGCTSLERIVFPRVGTFVADGADIASDARQFHFPSYTSAGHTGRWESLDDPSVPALGSSDSMTDVVLRGVWVRAPLRSVAFDGAGGVGASPETLAGAGGDEVGLPSGTSYSHPYHRFLGWTPHGDAAAPSWVERQRQKLLTLVGAG